MQRRPKGSKKKSPTFVHEPPMLFALNRAAKRQARRKGMEVTSVPMPSLLVSEEDGAKVYYLQHITGELALYTPYYQTKTEPDPTPVSVF